MTSGARGYLLVCQSGAEMLLDVGLQHSVEMLEFSVSNQPDDIYLSDRRESGWTESVTYLQHKKEKTFTRQMKVLCSHLTDMLVWEKYELATFACLETAYQEIGCVC